MLTLLNIGPEISSEVSVTDSFVPVALKCHGFTEKEICYVRYGDGERNLVEVELTEDGYVRSICLVAYRHTEIFLKHTRHPAQSWEPGFPCFDVRKLFEGPASGTRHFDAFENPTTLHVYEDRGVLHLRDHQACDYVGSRSLLFGLSQTHELVAVNFSMNLADSAVLRRCSLPLHD